MSPDNPTTTRIFQADGCSSSLGRTPVTWTGIGSSFASYTTEFASSSELAMPTAGKVTVRFKSRGTAFDDELWLAYPEERLIFKASSNNLGQTYDVGTFAAGTRLVFALKTPAGEAYYTDSSLNRYGCDHVSKLQLGTDRWELRWEDLYGLGEMLSWMSALLMQQNRSVQRLFVRNRCFLLSKI